MAALPAHRVAGLYLARRVRFGMKFGLETMRALVAEMGHPERAYPSLLVAGTNGKGSVAAYCDAALRASGLRTGRYTSPHLVRVNERITVDGREITDHDFGGRGARRPRRGRAARPPRGPRGAPDLLRGDDRRRLRALPPQAGGRGRPRGRPRREARRDQRRGARRLRDRQHRLRPRGVPGPDPRRDRGREGGRAARGAADRDRPAARGSAPGRPRALARDRRAPRRGEARRPLRRPSRRGPASHGGVSFDLRTPTAAYEGLRPLPGAHQRDNLLVAIRLLEEAKRAGVPVDLRKSPGRRRRHALARPARVGSPAIRRSSSTAPTTPPARAPWPRTLRDGPPIVLVFGAMADKDVRGLARELFPLAAAVVLTRPRVARAATPDELARRAGRLAARAHREPSVARALALARRLARAHGPRRRSSWPGASTSSAPSRRSWSGSEDAAPQRAGTPSSTPRK